jgi:hypothetical protein
VHEIKYDGYRLLARIEGQGRLITAAASTGQQNSRR